MAIATITAAADAIAGELAAGVASGLFPLPMVINRAFLHQYGDASTDINCTVEPATREPEQIARGQKQATMQILVMISQRVTARDNATLDPLCNLVESIQDYYTASRPLTGILNVQVAGHVSQDAMYDQGMLYEKSEFVSYFMIDLWAYGKLGPIALTVTAPATATGGVGFAFTVTAKDADGVVPHGYKGTITFSSGDTAAMLPSNGTLTNGVGIFTAQLNTTGSQVLTAADINTPSITGQSGVIAVSQSTAPVKFTITYPLFVTAGTGFSLTVTAQQANGATAPSYTGTVHFTTSDTGPSTAIPANGTLANGVGTFSATLTKSGNQTIIATDTGSSTLTGRTTPHVVVSAAPLAQFSLTAPSSAQAGAGFAFAIVAQDVYHNLQSSPSVVVHFTSSDGGATLPADTQILAGSRTVSATLNTPGNQTLTATDLAASSITGHSGSITVPGGGGGGGGGPPPVLARFGWSGNTTYPSNAKPFTLTLQALDSAGNLLTSYQGSATISSGMDTTGDPSLITFDGLGGGDGGGGNRLPYQVTLNNGQYILTVYVGGVFQAILDLHAVDDATGLITGDVDLLIGPPV
jgi:hypothetical protein